MNTSVIRINNGNTRERPATVRQVVSKNTDKEKRCAYSSLRDNTTPRENGKNVEYHPLDSRGPAPEIIKSQGGKPLPEVALDCCLDNEIYIQSAVTRQSVPNGWSRRKKISLISSSNYHLQLEDDLQMNSLSL